MLHASSSSLHANVQCAVGPQSCLTLVQYLQNWWDDVEEKPAAIAIAVAAIVALWALSGLVDAIDRLPIIGGLLEVVGLIVTGWFVYRYLLFEPDRCDHQQIHQSDGACQVTSAKLSSAEACRSLGPCSLTCPESPDVLIDCS